MTTYHELLGTTQEDSAKNIKQRYRLLSARLHPDKGGSKSLMQLLTFAYENVQNGRGEDDIEMLKADFSSEQQLKVMTLEIARLKHEVEGLRAENLTLKSQGQSKEASSIDTNDAVEHLNRELAQVKVELSLLKEHRQRLRTYKEGADKEITRLTQELHRALTANEVLETELTQAGLKNQVGPVHWASKFWLPVFVVFFIFVASLVSLSLFRPDIFVSQPVVIKDENNKEGLSEQKIAKPDTPTDVSSINEAKDKTEDTPLNPEYNLSDVSSSYWTVLTEQKSNISYIALSNQQGSMVIMDCKRDFFFFLRSDIQPLSVSANLIFRHQYKGYIVYAIPYGSGSNIEQWQSGRTLSILGQSFSGTGFDAAESLLKQECVV
ncbi:J domain-containing protein [Veronia pacifica]|uniref:J domain-containing protein n=1 Tax=Veronia pacifica TaxID=1080227 RepID=A0A1C3EBI4_9GAMM|nr:J domain-containing protein [Veronia pacifica]ODA30588.1 hypothetical protein A8L45_19845 [Veronia pacifica]